MKQKQNTLHTVHIIIVYYYVFIIWMGENQSTIIICQQKVGASCALCRGQQTPTIGSLCSPLGGLPTAIALLAICTMIAM